MENNLNKKASGLALIPFLIFVVIYLGAGIFMQVRGVDMAFYQFPSVTAMLIAVVVAFCMTEGTVDERFNIFARGAANRDILTMLVVFMMAGAFSAVASAMGGRDATVNLGLSLIPVQFLAAGVFIIAAFMGTATGTSMGAISAIMPIAVGVADKGGLNVALLAGACVGGAMFGDNLSMISDTTIAATRSQGVEMKDKFRVNLLIALPAAILTVVLLLAFGRPETVIPLGDLSFNAVKVLPYVVVLVMALIGVNVFVVLGAGILVAAVVGLITGAADIFSIASSIYSGITGMDECFYLSLMCGGMSELVAHNGGIQWLIEKMRSVVKSNKSAQLSIAALVSLADCACANNTVAIILSGDMAKDISREYKVDPRRTASLLDVFSCVFQGLIPYGGQVLVGASLVSAYGIPTNPTDIIPYIWYVFLLAVFGLLSIFIPFADGVCRKNPWNWEKGMSESQVAAAQK
jgi:Na+/H+ antiporter NhaC